MRWVNQLRLAALPTAVGCARRFVRHTLQAWLLYDDPELGDAVDLVTSELVTNAIQATGFIEPVLRYSDLYDRRPGLIVVRLSAADLSVVVEVADGDPTPPVVQEPTLDAESGRGLFLVEAISTAWGHYYPPGGGKVVWAELGVCAPLRSQPVHTGWLHP